jgi:putative chitinase
MVTLTVEHLQACLPKAKVANLEKFVEGFNETFEHFDINTPERMAMFIAQTAHESGNFATTEENLNYSAKGLNGIFKKYFPTVESAASYERKPQMIANRVYGGRMGNGNEASGEGYKFRGRGIIQLTGKDNYTNCGKALQMDLIADPDQVAKNPVAVLSAGWFWDTRKLNTWADKCDVLTVTKKINGGTIGLEDRTHHFEHILEVLRDIFAEEGHSSSDGAIDTL